MTIHQQDIEPEVVRKDTGLVWGIKESFLDYVRNWPGSTVDLAPGSGWLPDGRVYFSPDPQRPPISCRFRGGVRLRAHGGLLDVTIADPRIESHDQGYVLTAETWKSDTWQRIRFADLRWQQTGQVETVEHTSLDTGDVKTFIAAASLHPEATVLFDNTYPAGELLAPVVIRIEQQLWLTKDP